MTLTQMVRPDRISPVRVDSDDAAQHLATESRASLYLRHSARNTAPPGDLRSDVKPRRLLRSAQIMLAKRTVSRKRLPILLSLDEYRHPAFRYDTCAAAEMLRALQDEPLNSRNLRMIQQGREVLFHAVHHVDVPFVEFVERVDISRVGDCFRDVLGITTQVLQRNDAGRPTLQVERVAALAQPNYAAFLGKDELDVYRLEHVEYGPDEQRMWMLTLCSPNASTRGGSGYLSFLSESGGLQTRIEFLVRESVVAPRLLVLLLVDRSDWFRKVMAKGVYRRYWNGTVTSILARYEGREIGIGRPGRGRGSGHRRLFPLVAGAIAGALYLRVRPRRSPGFVDPPIARARRVR